MLPHHWRLPLPAQWRKSIKLEVVSRVFGRLLAFLASYIALYFLPLVITHAKLKLHLTLYHI